jgi:hypothetical protein
MAAPGSTATTAAEMASLKRVGPVVLFGGLAIAMLAGLVIAETQIAANPLIARTTTTPAGYATCEGATAYPDGRNGVAVYVTVPGPEVVNVGVVGQGRPRHLRQQITKRANGARFDFPNVAPVNSITVDMEKAGVVCEVPAPH